MPTLANSPLVAISAVFFLLLIASIADAFIVKIPNSSAGSKPQVVSGGVSSSSPRIGGSSALEMVFGPKQALAMEKMKNPDAFERTISGLMTQKKLSRQEAEKRYGEFLVDPDGFALRAAELERREKGYKDWEEQAILTSKDPEATRARIAAFKKKNSIKGTAIMVAFFAAAIASSIMNPYVPPPSM